MTLGDFSPQANAYRHARPSYPSTLIDMLMDDAKILPGNAVADFGAGTGIFTRLLVERGLKVTAIEPNADMRDRNEAAHADWVNGTFEASRLKSHSQCWAVAAQAFHWADPQRSLPEIRRVLQPGGFFTVLWNNRANRDSEILSWTENAIRRHVPEFDEAYRDRPWEKILESTGDFTFANYRTVNHVIEMSKFRYLELWKSHNRLNNIAGPERFNKLLAELTEHLNKLDTDSINVPYHCEAWSARRV